MAHISLTLTPEMLQQLSAAAAAQRRTRSNLTRKVLADYLAQQPHTRSDSPSTTQDRPNAHRP